MVFGDIPIVLAAAEGWKATWPFGPGTGEGLWPVVLKGLFVAAILGVLALVLRLLFGPGGPWRDKEWDEPDPESRDHDHNHTQQP